MHTSLERGAAINTFIARYFMLLFDLTPARAASEGHISLPDQGNIRLELQFDEPLPDALTCLLYLCPDRSTAHCFCRLLIMETAQILCTLKDVPSFLGVYPSDILPPAPSVTRSATHRKYRSAHGQRNALASHTSRTAILLPNFFRFLRIAPSRP